MKVPIHTLATLFAFTVAIAAPFLRALVAKSYCKQLFASLLAMVPVSNALSANTPTFETLAPARMIGALALPGLLGRWNTHSGAIRLAPNDRSRACRDSAKDGR